MLLRTYIYIFSISVVFLTMAGESAVAQSSTVTELNTGRATDDESLQLVLTTESATLTADTLKKKKSSIDTIIYMSASQMMMFDFKTKSQTMAGAATINFKEQKLSSDSISIFFDTYLLNAVGRPDSNGKIIGYPNFSEKGETFYGSSILYNFKTKKGSIKMGETELGEGFYFGEKIKRVSDSEMFIKEGRYTTCDAAHPHYYFGSPEMKVIAKDRIFIDPIYFYVEDMPIFVLPIGLFFPSKGGRQSGLIIPSFYFSRNRGVSLQDFGFYWAASDYFDSFLQMDYYSKGGYTIKNRSRWKLRNVHSGSADLEYGETRFDPDDDFATNYKVSLKHQHTFNPQERMDVNVYFMSQGFNKNTSYKLEDRLKQNMTSNASYSRSHDNGVSWSVRFDRDYNIITDEYRQTPLALNLSLPQYKPVKEIFGAGASTPKWLREISFKYSGSASMYEESTLQTESIYEPDTSYQRDYFRYNNRRSIKHSPSISVSPKFGYFTFKPSFSVNANNYFRSVDRSINPEDSSLVEEVRGGFFTEWWYRTSLDVSTRLYGIVKPKAFGINALRHTFQPTFGFSYTPDFSNTDMYDSYYDPNSDREIIYSRYEKDGGGSAPRQMSKSLNYSFVNNFEAKYQANDTTKEENVDLLRWNISGSYNWAADSMRFSDVNMQIRVPSSDIVTLSSSARFSLYDQDRTELYNSNTDKYYYEYHRVNRLNGSLDLTSFSVDLGTSFSSEGVGSGSSAGHSHDHDDADMIDSDSSSCGLGDRFRNRMEYEAERIDFFGDSSPGYAPFSLPWRVNMGLRFQYSQPLRNKITRSINFTSSFSFTVAESWQFSGNMQYDFVRNELLAPAINISKRMHCWQLSLSWYPIGYSRGFYLRFSADAPQLRDLKLEKRSSPILR